jgi:hypothetical protein
MYRYIQANLRESDCNKTRLKSLMENDSQNITIEYANYDWNINVKIA